MLNSQNRGGLYWEASELKFNDSTEKYSAADETPGLELNRVNELGLTRLTQLAPTLIVSEDDDSSESREVVGTTGGKQYCLVERL